MGKFTFDPKMKKNVKKVSKSNSTPHWYQQMLGTPIVLCCCLSYLVNLSADMVAASADIGVSTTGLSRPRCGLGRGSGGFRGFSAFRRLHKGPGPWAHGPRAHGPLGPWALGPMGPWAHGPMSPWALGPLGPRSGKLKITKRTSALEKNPRTFRSTRIDPSRQVIMTQAIFVHGKI